MVRQLHPQKQEKLVVRQLQTLEKCIYQWLDTRSLGHGRCGVAEKRTCIKGYQKINDVRL